MDNMVIYFKQLKSFKKYTFIYFKTLQRQFKKLQNHKNMQFKNLIIKKKVKIFMKFLFFYKKSFIKVLVFYKIN
jgi:hypothetical protein